MKKIIQTALFCFLSFGIVFALQAKDNQQSNVKELEIKTSAQCNMCKETIEKAMAYEKGVKTFNLDLNTKVLKVTYDEKKTNPDKIRKAVSQLGYDADDVPGNPKAYAKLPACCKKPVELKKKAGCCSDKEHTTTH